MNKSYEVTPILLYNLNLPPDLQYKTKNVLIFVILLGPNQPGDLNSFCCHLVDELKCLNENRIQAYNTKQWRLFMLRAYVTIVTRDIIVLWKIMMMKSPSGKLSCRACNIYGIKSLENEQRRGKIQYYPHLFKPDPLNLQQLPLQRHVWQTIRDVCIANKPNLFQDSGITGMSILLELRTIHFIKSFPHDTMYMILQNITEQIYKLWSGTQEINVREGMDFVWARIC